MLYFMTFIAILPYFTVFVNPKFSDPSMALLCPFWWLSAPSPYPYPSMALRPFWPHLVVPTTHSLRIVQGHGTNVPCENQVRKSENFWQQIATLLNSYQRNIQLLPILSSSRVTSPSTPIILYIDTKIKINAIYSIKSQKIRMENNAFHPNFLVAGGGLEPPTSGL